MKHLFLISLILAIPCILLGQTQNFGPLDLKFQRQAAERFVFTKEMRLKLSGLNPSTAVGLPVMHPHSSSENIEIQQEDGHLIFSGNGQTQMWIGGFNPFATYEVSIDEINGDAGMAIAFQTNEGERNMEIWGEMEDGKLTEIRWEVHKNGQTLRNESLNSEGLNFEAPFTFRVLMAGSGFNVLIEKNGTSYIAGQADFYEMIDWRRKELIHFSAFYMKTKVEDNSSLHVSKAWSGFTGGVGQADIRLISYANGEPMFKDGRVYYSVSLRGRSLPEHLQGIISMNPTLFDPKLEGIIAFDRNDGLWRNDIASHIFYDRKVKKWRGFTTGFSAYGDPQQKEEKQLMAITSEKDPRHGFTIMKAHPVGIVGDHEDPSVIYDEEVQKWRVLFCSNLDGYHATIYESEQWDGPYERISGPVEVNSTGTTLQKIGDEYYAFFGSSDHKFFVYSYPELDSLGTLQMNAPPWNSETRSRVWPAILPLPEGYPARYMLMTFDRYNYPGIEGPNWTYGALYKYYARLPKGIEIPYEFENVEVSENDEL